MPLKIYITKQKKHLEVYFSFIIPKRTIKQVSVSISNVFETKICYWSTTIQQHAVEMTITFDFSFRKSRSIPLHVKEPCNISMVYEGSVFGLLRAFCSYLTCFHFIMIVHADPTPCILRYRCSRLEHARNICHWAFDKQLTINKL